MTQVVQKTTDPKSYVPKSYVPTNKDRINMTKVEAIEDGQRLRERDARKEAAGKAFDEEEKVKKVTKKKKK